MPASLPEDSPDRREESRYASKSNSVLPASVVCFEQQVLAIARTVDVSAAGAKIMLPQSLPTGAAVEVQLVPGVAEVPQQRRARVCWALPADGENWWVGVLFEEDVSDRWIQALVQHAIVGLPCRSP